MALTESSARVSGRPSVVVVVGRRSLGRFRGRLSRESTTSGSRPGSTLGGWRLRSSSRGRRLGSSGNGNPNGPVRRVVVVGTGSSPGNVGGVVPLGDGFRITSSVGNCDVV